MRISVDGGAATTALANVNRPDVAAAYPQDGADHGYDVTIPASSSPSQVCVTATHVGSGADTTVCQQVDDVVAFAGNSISYNMAGVQIGATTLNELDTLTVNNGSSVQQSTTISGSRTVTDTQSWTDTYGVKVTMSAGIGIPIFASSNVSVEGSATFTQNGSTSTAVTYSWSQPVIEPPQSTMVVGVAVGETTLVVPYTISGNCVYNSGAAAPYSITGMYTGINSHDLEVTISQFNLDGTPAAHPVHQPAPTVQKVG